MKCEKCGNQIKEGDLFCQNCGNKLESSNPNEEYVDDSIITNSSKEVNENKGHKIKRKKGIFIGIFLLGITLIVSVLILSKPKDIEISTSELSKAILENELDDYNSNNLHVKGVICRDTRNSSKNEKDGYFILLSKLDDIDTGENMIVFKYNKDIPEDVGTGSEVIVHGQLENDKDSEITFLVADDVEVLNKKESIYDVDFDELEQNDYTSKKIKITGRMVYLLGKGHYITNEDISHSIKLNGLTESEYAKYYKNGSYVVITGRLGDDHCLDIEKIEQNEFSKEMSTKYGATVSQCYDNMIEDGTEITISGIYERNVSYSVPYAIADSETGQFISLSLPDSSINLEDYFESGDYCVLSGYISMGGTGYILTVTAIG